MKSLCTNPSKRSHSSKLSCQDLQCLLQNLSVTLEGFFSQLALELAGKIHAVLCLVTYYALLRKWSHLTPKDPVRIVSLGNNKDKL